MDQSERDLLERIDSLLQEPQVASCIDEIADRVEWKFKSSNEALAWEDVPLSIYQGKVPEMIRSSWVFLLRSDSTSGAERHPNSHQRVASWRGRGDLQIWNNDAWESHILSPDFQDSIEYRWASIPVNVWHQALVGPGNHWIVVSFHTASAEELVEERPDPAEPQSFRRRVYNTAHS
jgi:hypothetical protein